MSIKIGCDPEVFIVDKAGNYVSAHDIIPGSKKEPFKVEFGAVQPDGVAAEFNIDPAENEKDFNRNITIVLDQMTSMIKKANKDYSLKFVPYAKFSDHSWSSIPENSKILGCDPDFNINGEVNPNPIDKLQNQSIRTAAGHIHIGWTEVENPMSSSHFDDCLYISKSFFTSNLNWFVPQTTDEVNRMEYYGYNGAWRPKKYGIELRAPSNLWVKDETSRIIMFNNVRNTFRNITGI